MDCPVPWHDEAVKEFPNTSHQHAEVMVKVYSDDRIAVVYTDELVCRPFTLEEFRYCYDEGPVPSEWNLNAS